MLRFLSRGLGGVLRFLSRGLGGGCSEICHGETHNLNTPYTLLLNTPLEGVVEYGGTCNKNNDKGFKNSTTNRTAGLSWLYWWLDFFLNIHFQSYDAFSETAYHYRCYTNICLI